MITQHTLSNGLTVLMEQDHASPVAAILTHVNTGYFQEEDRYTGISHLLEHMFFKGTPRRPGPEDIAQATKSIGGVLNAYTFYEETGYYTVVPSSRLEEALDIQADALANTKIDAEQLRLETEVVLQEAQQKKDSAWSYATESLLALAFDRHRIRRWRIGEPEILRALTRDDMLAYYRGTYHPENMVLVLAGDIDPETALPAVERHYGSLATEQRYRNPGPAEPAQAGPRFRQMRGDIRQRLVLLGFHVPPVLHEDGYALDILSAILADGRSSRLFQSLRERAGIATALQAYNMAFRETGYFVVAGESLTDDLEAMERALWAEITRLQDDPPSLAEMERVRTRLRSRWVFEGEEALGRARRLASFQSLGDYRLAEQYLERLLAVTPGEVSAAACRYLHPDNASLLEYLPDNSPVRPLTGWSLSENGHVGETAVPEETPTVQAAVPVLPVAAEAPGGWAPAVRLDLPGGGFVAARPSGSSPVISLEILRAGGRRHESPETAGITNLMLRCLMKGTRTRTAEQIAREFEALGSSLDWVHGLDYWGHSFRVVSDRFEDALSLAADVSRNPIFDPVEVQREKETMYADIRRAMDNSMDRAVDLMDEAAYGTHPYGFPERGLIEALERVTPDDLHAWHARLLASDPVVGAGGALDAARLRDAVADALGEASAQTTPDTPLPAPLSSVVERVEERDRKQSALSMGFFTVDAQSDERFALDVLATILSGLGGRLFAEVRGRQGLAYTVTAWHVVRRDSGMFSVYTATDPANEEKARAAILAELNRVRQEPVTGLELERAQAYIEGAKLISLQTSAAQSRELSRNSMYGRGLEAGREYVERVKALTATDIQTVAQRYLDEERYAVGVLRGRDSGVGF